MPQVAAAVRSNERVAARQHLLTLEAPGVAQEARAGQFVHVRVGPGYDPLLRRPFSVLRADPDGGLLWILVKVFGRGTRMLAATRPGATLDVLGPLGRGFWLPEGGGEAVLVAGGVGVAPIIFWADELQAHHSGVRVVSIYGAASDVQLACWLELAARSDEFYVATEDGSAGEQGLAIDLLAKYLAERQVRAVFACGPAGMLAAAAEMCQRAGVPCLVSLEQFMGCGVGACLGCAVPAAGGGYVHVCKDGPVFEAGAIDWARLLREQGGRQARR